MLSLDVILFFFLHESSPFDFLFVDFIFHQFWNILNNYDFKYCVYYALYILFPELQLYLC